MSNENHRKFSRTEFNTTCEFTSGGKTLELRLLNISMKGLLAETEDPNAVEMNAQGELVINLAHSEIVIQTVGKLIHREGERLGFYFLEIDLDSMVHLRKLLEYNTGSPDRIEQELSFLHDAENQ